MTNRITNDNIKKQLIRLNTLTLNKYKVEIDETDHRYCLMNMNSEQVTLWLKISEFWDCMYSMIRLMQIETDKPRVWEE